MPVAQPVDLNNCDREPIHVPGSIQPHGALLALDTTLGTVLRHSANAASMLGLDGDPNGRSFESLFGTELAHTLRNALTSTDGEPAPALVFAQALPSGKRVDIAVHRYRSTSIVEFEPSGPPTDAPLQLARAMITRIAAKHSAAALLQTAAALIRATLGYDRAMIYRFERDGSGKVVNEAKRHDLESFLGQYFPASDIPQQARALYLKNTIRVISNVDFERIPLVPVVDLSGEPLDLSHAHLRSVSPIHCEYLRNMGVSASMSISIVIDGALWGMIACHHYSPRTLSMGIRVAAEMFGEFLSLHLSAIRHKNRLDIATRARDHLDHILQLGAQPDIGELLHDNLQEFGGLMANTGFGLYLDGNWTGIGITPSQADIPALARFAGSVGEGKVWATDSITRHYPAAEAYHPTGAGFLSIPLSQLPRDYLFFFRAEFVQTLNWGGDPHKTYESGPLGDRLTPRKSFAIWKETVHRRSEPWSDDDRDLAEAARGALVEVVLRHSELRAEERSKADVRQRMLNQELNHRVKNILSVIKALVGQPIQEGRSLGDYVTTLKGRIQALARAHDQVIRGDGGGGLLDLLEAELTPYRGEAHVCRLEGPLLSLDSRAYSVMALVLHELATNAAKYGSLSTQSGSITVSWLIGASGDCEITWRESDGPFVSTPTREGFGTALLDRSITFDLGGESRVTYRPAGLEAWFRIPSRHVKLGAPGGPPSSSTEIGPVPVERWSIAGDLDVLLVEDQMLIAMDVEQMLNDRGISTVTTANSSNEALKFLQLRTPDAAILDVNLGAMTSIPVAAELTRRGVPFVFATGYNDGDLVSGDYADVPIRSKALRRRRPDGGPAVGAEDVDAGMRAPTSSLRQ